MLSGMAGNSIRIRPLQASDAPIAARLHIAGQPGTFLTQLGQDVLETIYTTLPQAGFGFVAVPAMQKGETAQDPTNAQEGVAQVYGFISGAPGIGGVLRQVLTGDQGRRGLRLVRLLGQRIVRKPVLLRHTFETLLYPLRTQSKGAHTAHAPKTATTIDLLSIMVERDQRSQGIGAQLMTAFIQECGARSATSVEVTVDANNAGACRFYAQHDFVHLRDFRLYGRAMRLYRKELTTPANSAQHTPAQSGKVSS